MQISTISVYHQYLNVLKILGIFPYKLSYGSSDNPDNRETRTTNNNTDKLTLDFGEFDKSLTSVGFHKRGFFAAWNYVVFGFFYCYFVFQIGRFTERFMAGSGAIEMFGMSCWIWKPIFVGSFALHFHQNKNALADFYTTWHRVELVIHQEWSRTLPFKVSAVCKQIIRKKRFAYVYVPLWTVLIMTWMTLNHLDSPGFPSYISSFIGNPLDPVKFSWLLPISVLVQILALIPILVTFDHFYIVCLTFSNSISRIVILLTDPFQSSEEELDQLLRDCKSDDGVMSQSQLSDSETDPYDKKIFEVSKFLHSIPLDGNLQIIAKLQLAMQHYGMLEKLTKEFNRLHRWMLFLYQAVILVNFCILIFVPLRFSKIFPWTSLVVFFVSFLFFAFHLCTLLPSMGNVFGKSSDFRTVWERRLARVCHTIPFAQFLQLKSELDSCLPFGFQTGTFYTLHPGSMLLFYSYATSYLIVLLQLDIRY